MRKMIIIIIILATILISMIIYKNAATGITNQVNIQEIQKIEESISKIYLWKEITNEALPIFENVNNTDELWVWEVTKKNLEQYEVSKDEIQKKVKEVFGEEFNKQFPQEGNSSFEYDKTTNKYYPTEVILDQMEDSFLLNKIEKTDQGYIVEIVEYLQDYTNGDKVIVRNLGQEELGQVSIYDSETKIQEIVKNNINRFDKKKIYFKAENDNLIVQKVEKIQE